MTRRQLHALIAIIALATAFALVELLSAAGVVSLAAAGRIR